MFGDYRDKFPVGTVVEHNPPSTYNRVGIVVDPSSILTVRGEYITATSTYIGHPEFIWAQWDDETGARYTKPQNIRLLSSLRCECDRCKK